MTPDVAPKTFDQDARTRVFFLIYRRFMRPRELLEMFIARFDDLGDYIDDEQSDANNTRLSWRLHQLDHGNPYDLNSLTSSRNSSISGLMGGTVNGAQMSAAVSIISDEDSDSGYYDSNSVQSEEDMDEDREWGLADEDDTLQETASNNSSNSSIANSAIPDSIAAFAQLVSLSGGSSGSRYPQRNLLPSHLPARDRRSSTGSFAQSSSCTMENFVAGRRGSASSVSSNPGPFTVTPLQQQPGIQKNNSTGAFGECDMQSFMLQPIGSIPYINKRGSSHAYRQQRSQLNNLQNATTPPLSPVPPTPTSETFISGPFSAAVTKAAMALKDTLDEKIHPFSQQHGKSTCCLLSGLSPVYGSFSESSTMSSLAFIEVKDVVMAEQLTFLEYNIFKRLKPRDMLRHVWKTKKGSVAFQACISHFNRISRWVGTMILLPVKAKHRAKVMERFISIAKILRDMGNYNTTMAVIAAMNTSAIHRLIQTREFLQSKEIWNTFKELEHLMSSERSFFEYRSALRVTKLPCIPYLGVHSGDLLSISEGNRDVRQDGSTLHWQKFVLMTDVITLVMSFQQEPSYKIQPDPSVIRMIIDMPVLDDEALYSKSVAVEPTKLNHSRSLSKFTFF
ncbi:hypothetical protein BGZ46_010315 [Entomortierella lignicola]|nr:hypothetical protein BGZ46_010315 [Entomortierella lignicola]